MAGAAPTTLSDKQSQKGFWYATLLDNHVSEALCDDLKSGCLGSTTMTIQAAHRIAAVVFAALKRLPKNALYAVYWQYRRGRWELIQVPAAPLEEASFLSQFIAYLHQTLPKYAKELVRRVCTVPQYAGEFLSSLVARTLNVLHAQHHRSMQSSHQRQYLSEPYPFLQENGSAQTLRHFGAARHTQLFEEHKRLLATAPYRAALQLAGARTLKQAPENRAEQWAICVSAICRNASPVDVSEALKFPAGVQGVGRARVMISRMARRVHDEFFRVLCQFKLMTRKLAEFMAMEFRMPAEVVGEGMRLLQTAAMHALDYAVGPRLAKGLEVNPRPNL
jgi:hypothetical protein